MYRYVSAKQYKRFSKTTHLFPHIFSPWETPIIKAELYIDLVCFKEKNYLFNNESVNNQSVKQAFPTHQLVPHFQNFSYLKCHVRFGNQTTTLALTLNTNMKEQNGEF